jgi:hypothetical protein
VAHRAPKPVRWAASQGVAALPVHTILWTTPETELPGEQRRRLDLATSQAVRACPGTRIASFPGEHRTIPPSIGLHRPPSPPTALTLRPPQARVALLEESTPRSRERSPASRWSRP